MNLQELKKIANRFKILTLKYSFTIGEKFSLKLLGGINNLDKITEYSYEYDDVYFCTTEELNLVLEKSKIIKKIYPILSNEEIYTIMLYIYYILNLIEAFNFPYYLIKELISVNNELLAIEIIKNITMYDIIYEDTNISANIRQSFLLGNNIQIMSTN
jgi:hypothetical protein